MLIVEQHVYDEANDKRQLVPTVEDVSHVVGSVDNGMADTGYFSKAAVLAVESGYRGTTAFVAMKRQSHGRSVVQLEARADPPPPATAFRWPRAWNGGWIPRRAGSSTVCASKRSNRLSASLRKPWSSGVACCAGWRKSTLNGPW